MCFLGIFRGIGSLVCTEMMQLIKHTSVSWVDSTQCDWDRSCDIFKEKMGQYLTHIPDNPIVGDLLTPLLVDIQFLD